jgi:hypothetical protein
MLGVSGLSSQHLLNTAIKGKVIFSRVKKKVQTKESRTGEGERICA